MSNCVEGTCLVCGGKAEISIMPNHNYKFVKCETCGRFEINTFMREGMAPIALDKLASYLYYNGKISQPINTQPGYFYNVIGFEDYFNVQYVKHPYSYLVTDEIVENWYPHSFSDKVDTLLLGLWQQYQYLGYEIILSDSELFSATFVMRYDESGKIRSDDECLTQASFLLDYLQENDYIKPVTNGRILLKTKALQRIEELQKNNTKNSKTAFVAMSFAPDMKDVREAIRSAVVEAGYIPRIMDEIQHNHQIVPEMLYEIRQARFVIAELTNHNNGAYFEAGYALGLGKDVIQICREDTFGTDGHFDVKQVNTIMWKDFAQLRVALVNRIQATI